MVAVFFQLLEVTSMSNINLNVCWELLDKLFGFFVFIFFCNGCDWRGLFFISLLSFKF